MNLSKSIKNHFSIYLIAWFTIAIFYFYQYILRISPGIMVLELRQAFKLTAEEFSSLGSIYLLSYSLLQIPLGFFLDYLGVRRVILISITICIIGICIFANSLDLWMLQLGRFMIGLGSAPAFICALKIVQDHLPEKYRGLLMGVTLAIGTLGALLSGKFMVAILEKHGWQNAVLLCAALGGFIFTLVFSIIPQDKKKSIAFRGTLGQLRHGLKAIFRSPEIVIYSIIAISVYTPLCVLADLWGTAFLMEKYALQRSSAAQLSLYLYGGLTLGSLLLPWFSMQKNRSKEVIQICTLGLMISLFTLLYANNLSLVELSLTLTFIGIFCGAEMICFAGAADYSPSSHTGLTLGVVNTLNMLGGALATQLIGWYLDFQWKGAYGLNGERFYGASEFTAAFSLLIALIFACGLLSIKLPKKNVPEIKNNEHLLKQGDQNEKAIS